MNKNNDYLFMLNLKGSNKDIATFEFENLWKLYFKENINLIQLNNTYFYFKSKLINFSKINKELKENWTNFTYRLTYTNQIFFVIKKYNNYNEYIKNIPNENISNFLISPFKANIKIIRNQKENKKLNYDDYLKYIWNKFENPKVDLVNYKREYFFYDSEKKGLFFSIKVFENKKGYLKRMPKLRKVVKPYTLKSDLARACINFLNIKENEILLDPFAGIGGILLEGYDMNINIIANDINWDDLKSLKMNFEYFFPEKVKKNQPFLIRTICDSSKQFLCNNSVDGIVTDIPYGKSSRLIGNTLYENFLKSAYYYLKPNKRLVVVYANFIDFENLALKYFKKIKLIEQYINKSLTRKIIILEKEKN